MGSEFVIVAPFRIESSWTRSSILFSGNRGGNAARWRGYNSGLQDERNCELCSRQATNEFFSQEYLLRSRYFSFLFSFLYIKSEFFFSFTLLFHVTSNYNEVFYPILTRRECCCSYEKRFYTLLYSWKSINRLKLSRDILYWIASYQIYYFLDFM